MARKEEGGRPGRRDRGMSQHFSSSFLPPPACQKMMPMLSRAPPPPPPRLRKRGGGGSAHSLPNGRTHTHTSFPLTPEGEKKYSGHAKEHYGKVTLPFFRSSSSGYRSTVLFTSTTHPPKEEESSQVIGL